MTTQFSFDDKKSEFMQNAMDLIDKNGWMLQGVYPLADDPDPGPSWIYTIGLGLHNLPELCVTGLPGQVGGVILNSVAESMVNGVELYPLDGTRYSGILEGFDTIFGTIDDVSDGDWFNVAHAFYGNYEFGVRQIIMPDVNNNFPGDANFQDSMHAFQPPI